MERSIAIIDASVIGIEGSTRQWITYFNQNRIQPHLISVYRDAKWVSEEDVYNQLSEAKPDTIIFGGSPPWRYAESFKACTCYKYNFWYDDPILRLEGLGYLERAKECYDRVEQDFKFRVWDDYWIKKMAEKGILAKLTHLAADPEEFFQADTELSDECVFIGGLHSRSEIHKRRGWISRIFQKTLDFSLNYVSTVPMEEEIPSWDKVETIALRELSDGDRRLYREIESLDFSQVLQARWCLWAHSKNEVRVRALKEVLKVSPLMIFTDTKQKGHANPDELKHMLGEYGPKLKVIDTSEVHPSKLGQICHYGALHIGATDPQSVDTGIPYRVFQTMAAGRPLLTDQKPGWESVFGSSCYFTYNSPLEIADKTERLLKDKNLRREMGKSARNNAVLNHTWGNRFEKLFQIDAPKIGEKVVKQMSEILNESISNHSVVQGMKVGNNQVPTNVSRAKNNDPYFHLCETPDQ